MSSRGKQRGALGGALVLLCGVLACVAESGSEPPAASLPRPGAQALSERAKPQLQLERGLWEVSALTWSPEGERLAVATRARVHWFRAEAGQEGLVLEEEASVVVSQQVLAMAFAPGGEELALGTRGSELRLLELSSGAVVGELHGLGAPAESLVFARGGQLLAASLLGRSGALAWEVASRKLVGSLAASDGNPGVRDARGGGVPQMFATSQQGGVLWRAAEGGLSRWDVRDPAFPVQWTDLGEAWPWSVAVEERGHWVAVGDLQGRLLLLKEGEAQPAARVQAHAYNAQAVFLEGGKRLLSASTDGHVRLFALPELGALSDFDTGLEPVDAVALQPGGSAVVFVSRGQLHVVNVGPEGARASAPRPPLMPISTLAVGQQGTLALGFGDGEIAVYRPGQPWQWLSGHEGRVTALAFDASGARLASASLGGQALLWSLEQAVPRVLHTLQHPDQVWGVDWGPGGQLLATASREGGVRLWQAHSGQLLWETVAPCPVGSVRFAARGKWLLAGQLQGNVVGFPVAEELGARGAQPQKKAPWPASKESDCERGLEQWPHGMAVSPEGDEFAAIADAHEVALGRVPSGLAAPRILAAGVELSDERRSLHPLTVARARGGLVAVGGRGGVWLWRVEGGLRKLLGFVPQAVDELAFSADGSYLVGIEHRGFAHGFRVGSAGLESTLELGWWSPQSGYAQGEDGRVQSLGSEPLRGSCRQGVRTLPMAECGEHLARAGVVGAALGN